MTVDEQFPLRDKHILIGTLRRQIDTNTQNYIDFLEASGATVRAVCTMKSFLIELGKKNVDLAILPTLPSLARSSPQEIVKALRYSDNEPYNKFAPKVRNTPIIAMCTNILGPGPKRSNEARDLHWARINPSPELMVKIVMEVMRAPRLSVAEAEAARIPLHDAGGLVQQITRPVHAHKRVATATV